MLNPKLMKVDPRFREWLIKRQKNIQKILGVQEEEIGRAACRERV